MTNTPQFVRWVLLASEPGSSEPEAGVLRPEGQGSSAPRCVCGSPATRLLIIERTGVLKDTTLPACETHTDRVAKSKLMEPSVVRVLAHPIESVTLEQALPKPSSANQKGASK